MKQVWPLVLALAKDVPAPQQLAVSGKVSKGAGGGTGKGLPSPSPGEAPPTPSASGNANMGSSAGVRR